MSKPPYVFRSYPKKPPRSLPHGANEFISLLAATLKPGTCKHYETALRHFYTCLKEHRCPLTQVARKHLTQWFADLHGRQLSASVRATYIICTRSYLCWLHEEGLLSANPSDLIRPTDIPRRPTYLPRPLPPEVDLELQKRFRSSDDLLQKGLLLMRNTGMRIGELQSLPYNCIRTDLQHNTFLKVPLGKLNNERLVPLDENTRALIEEIQSKAPAQRTFLLESSTGKKVQYNMLRQSLRTAAHDFSLPEPITSHRLRHTYATTLLNAGVSLEGVMRLLGHRDFNMTLRYADVTLQTVRNEFFLAINQLQNTYGNVSQAYKPEEFDPFCAISDIIRWLQRERAPATTPQKKQIHLLVKKLKRICEEFQKINNDIEKYSPELGKLAG